MYRNPDRVYDLTMKGNTIAVISYGTALLGLGNIGAKAAIPVMEGKAMLFKKFAGMYGQQSLFITNLLKMNLKSPLISIRMKIKNQKIK